MSSRTEIEFNPTELAKPVVQKVNNISLRLTDDELETILAQAKKLKMNRSDYLRHRALQPARRSKKVTAEYLSMVEYQELMLLRRELIAQGNNLNQIARGINRANMDGRAVGIEPEALKGITAANQQIAKKMLKLGVKK